LKTALRQIPVFSDLSDEQLDWFTANSEDLRLAPGDILIREGDPADSLFVVLEGEMRGRQESAGADALSYVARAGQVTGMLPFSRMTTFQLVVRAVLPTRIARLHKDRFDEMLVRIPQLLPRLVGVLADRIREVSRMDQQREKLMALGKLSAGLAHELNNPASAASRAAQRLRQANRDLRKANETLDRGGIDWEKRRFIGEFEEEAFRAMALAPALDSLEESDRQDEVSDWLRRHGVESDSELVSGLVDARLDPSALNRVAARFSGPVIGHVLCRVRAWLAIEQLTRDIEGATGRISDLVRAVKEYSYMDQQPEQRIDIHGGIESTLTMLKFRWKKGIEVKREFDQTLPAVFAHGSELNQVWTNLIDNAIDAMNGKGELTIRTSRELDCALVEIIDNGPGIPDSVKPHLFEPFFTTKDVGSGTGLGLDTVYRVVRAHHGDVSFQSKPGRTTFQVRLPFDQPVSGTN
jgi:signal transduction histidine kinase